MTRPALKACAAVLSAAIVLTSPGAAPYAAAAQNARSGPAAGAPVVLPSISMPAPSVSIAAPVVSVSIPKAATGIDVAISPVRSAVQAAVPLRAQAAPAAVSPAELARQSVEAVTSALSAPQAQGEAISASSAEAFEGSARPKAGAANPSVAGDARAIALARRSSLTRGGARASRGAPRAERPGARGARAAGRRLVTGSRTFSEKAVATWTAMPWGARVAAAAAGAVLVALALPYYVSAAVAVPLVIGTCSSMQERAIKDAVILPRAEDEAQKALAKIELDQALVAFGKDLKKAAEADAKVTSRVNAHDAEHAMEEPILELFPKWKQEWKEGKGPTREEALTELRAAVVARMGKILSREDEETIERVFQQSGGWERFLAWEQKYGALEALKKAAEADAEEERAKVKVQKKAGSSGENSGQMGGTAALMVAVGLGLSWLVSAAGIEPGVAATLVKFGIVADPSSVFATSGLMFGAMVGMLSFNRDTGPKPGEPVALDAYLLSLGLDDKEAELLKAYTTDMGAKDIAPVIGRSPEIGRLITILSKPSKMQNSAMILGDKGVGKTAIVEAVAKRLYLNQLPSMKGRRVLELDMGRLTAGTGVQGELEDRLAKLRAVIAKTDNKVILFVDEIHTLLKNNTQSNTVPDMLKTPLRDGELTMIGATTKGEFQKYVEKDPAFADRFDTVKVDEPSIEEAVEMLEGDLEYLEAKFDVKIDPEAARAAVVLSSRYVPEKYLPRKAHLLLANAIAEAKPAAARDRLQVQIDQLADRLRIFVKRYAALAKAGDGGDAAKKAEIVRSYNRVVAIYQTILSLEDQQRAIAEERIGREHVQRTLARETGIDIGDLSADDYEKLKNMDRWFKDRVVGQDDAIAAVAETVRRSKSGMSDPDKPLGVFLFRGPTGVGKTEIARRLAEFLFNDKDAMTRMDMSEYMEKFAAQRLMGAPPGYVGYEEGGQLTEAVRQKPYQVVLLDEVEKAHDDVFNTLLQVFDDGRMTDGKGRTADFKNTIIIMTSNIPEELLKKRFKPEFLNRIDKIVEFNGLTMDQAETIVNIQLGRVRERMAAQDLELKVEPAAVKWLAETGFDPAYGARPLKRTVEAQLATKVGEFILEKRSEGTLINGGVITVGSDGEKLTFALKANPPPSIEMSPLPDGPLGAKLRNILEEAVRDGGEGFGRNGKFESLLFPDRVDVILDGPLGAFEPNTEEPESTDGGRHPLNAPAGEREPNLDIVRGRLSAATEGRSSEAQREAAEAWLDAFADVSKALAASESKPGVYVREPASDAAGRIGLAIRVSGSGEDLQGFLRLARDHFSVPLEDEGAVRKRAAALKDEGKTADRALLEAKRLIENVTDARFGFKFDESTGVWTFWLSMPVGEKPAPPAAPERPAGPAEEAPAPEPEAPAAPAAPEPGGPFLPDSLPPLAESALLSIPAAASATLRERLMGSLADRRQTTQAQDAARFWLESSVAALSEASGSDSAALSVLELEDGSLVVAVAANTNNSKIRESGFYARQLTAPADVLSVVETIPGATFGVRASPSAAGALQFWLRLPGVEPEQAQAPAEEPVTALEARTSPGKMLRFLAPRAATPLGALRELTAELLESQSSASRLIGLHLAGALLPKDAFAEIVGISRGVRISDEKETLLFAELAGRTSAGMTAQRRTVRENFDTQLREAFDDARRRRDSSVGVRDLRFSARFLDGLGLRLDEKQTSAARKEVGGFNGYWRRAVALNVLGSLALLSGFYWIWSHQHLGLLWSIVWTLAAQGILWAIFISWIDDRRSAGLENTRSINEVLRRAGAKSHAKRLARARLEAASRGRATLTEQDAADIVAHGAADVRVTDAWIRRLEKAYPKGSTPAPAEPSSRRANSLASLGRLHAALPQKSERARAVLFAPLKARWMPSNATEYANALGAWLERDRMSRDEAEEIIDALTAFPLDNSSRTWSLLLPAMYGMARQPELSSSQRASLDQLISGLAAEAAQRDATGQIGNLIDAARARARLGRAVPAWSSLRDVIQPLPFNRWSSDSMRSLTDMIAEAPPGPADRAWLEPRLRELIGSNQTAVRPQARMALARLREDRAERIGLLLAALNEAVVGNNQTEDQLASFGELVADLHKAVAELRAANKAEAAALQTSVEAALARLKASAP